MTGLPAAKADAVSPPATENPSGKLLAQKTATGPERSQHRRFLRFTGVADVLGSIDPRIYPGALS